MITKNTVFIIGAGGSCAYGFPSGAALLLDARDDTEAASLRYTHGLCTEGDIQRFRSVLVGSLNSSLDALLEFRTDLAEVGRKYIAGRILSAEEGHSPHNRQLTASDWLGYVFEKMDDGCRSLHDFSKNNVTFVTYNYDRLIEHRLSAALRAKWGHVHEQVNELIAAYWVHHPVIHLHGSLGDLNIIPFGNHHSWATDKRHMLFGKAHQTIKIIHEADGEDPQFRQAREALRNASRVFFLGFRFGRLNVDRLDLSNINRAARVVCCRFGMTDAEVAVDILEPLKKRTGDARPALSNSDCIGTLRDHVDIFVDRYG